jgi:hypothetical protein
MVIQKRFRLPSSRFKGLFSWAERDGTIIWSPASTSCNSISTRTASILQSTYVIRSFLSLPFFSPPKAIFVPGMYFLGFSRYSYNVSVCHSMPFCLLASVYEKPSTWPVLRPKRPCKLGPILFPSFSTTLWHCAHRVWIIVSRMIRRTTRCHRCLP